MRILKSGRFWALVFVLIVAVSLAAICFMYFGKPESPVAEISVDGEVVKTVSLDKDRSFEIETQWGSNTVSVSSGKIAVTESDCKNQICVKSGYISTGTAPIICAPHKLVIRIVSEKADADV